MEPLLEEVRQDSEFIGTFSLLWLWAIYLIFTVSGAVTLVPDLMLPAGIAILFAFLLVRIGKRRKHPILSTHYRWLYRTFWIGMGVYLTIISLLMLAIAAPAVDTTSLTDAMLSGNMMSVDQMNDLVIAKQPASNKVMLAALGGVFGLWWLWRCAKGMYALYNQKAVSNIDSWL